MLALAVIIASIMNSPIEKCAVFTEKIQWVEESPAGKKYRRSMTVTYVDLNGDGWATALDRREKDWLRLAAFAKRELPAWYQEYILPKMQRVGVKNPNEGDLPMKTAFVKKTNPYDNHEQFAKAFKQFGAPTLKKLEGMMRVAKRDYEKEQRSKGRSR